MLSCGKETLVEVRASPLHRMGLFACTQIAQGVLISEYKGERITKAEGRRRAALQAEKAHIYGEGKVYLFSLNNRYDLDGSQPENIARYANHSCLPNCEMQNLRGHLWLVASRNIKIGEELTFDYAYDMTAFFEHPCNCRQPGCCGYIVRSDLRWKVRALLTRRRRQAASRIASGIAPTPVDQLRR